MFADSLLETSWTHRTRRSWTTLTSFGLQALLIGLLLLIPLLETAGLPAAVRILPTPLSWGAPPPPVPHPQPLRPNQPSQSNLADNVVIAPSSIPHHVEILHETEPPPQVSFNNGPGVEGAGNGSRDGVWKSLSDSMRPVVAMPNVPPPTKPTFRPSTLLEGSLIGRVQPTYPPMARVAHVQGAVVLAALIGKNGTMEHVQLISGHPLLVQAAVQAVSQWRYKPYILNGEAIEVETQITVNFILGTN